MTSGAAVISQTSAWFLHTYDTSLSMLYILAYDGSLQTCERMLQDSSIEGYYKIVQLKDITRKFNIEGYYKRVQMKLKFT